MVAPLMVSLILFLETDWRYFFLALLIPQIALIAILWFMDIPKKVRVANSLKTLFVTNKKIISNSKFILCSMIIFFYVSILNTFFVWFTSYFENIDVGINISSIFLSLFGLSIFLGMVIKNKLLKHFMERKLLLFSFVISFFFLAGILFLDNLILKNILIFLFGINMAGNFTLTFSIGSELFPEYANSVSGLMVAFAHMGVMVFQYLSGYASEYWSKDSVLYINMAILFILIVLAAVLNLNKRFSRVSP
jgi:predicted MFS family arabinose efflux permease